MDVQHVKLLLDSCQSAAHLDALLPSLPQGVTPRCVRVIEQIAKRTEDGSPMRVSDISEMLDVTRPGITAVVRQLNELGYVAKEKDRLDNRVTWITLTDKGRTLLDSTVTEYHQHLTEVLAEIGDEGAEQLARLIDRVVALINEDTRISRLPQQ